jgi:hypothetical protein
VDEVASQHIPQRVLLDPAGTAMQAFQARGTPMGVLIEDGRIASPVAAGDGAVLHLARRVAVA